MKNNFAVNTLLITALLLSRASNAAPYVETLDHAQENAAGHTNKSNAVEITARLQMELSNDVHAETVQRIKDDSLQQLGRQLQDADLLIDVVPATRTDFEITISNADRQIRLTSR